MMIHPLPPKVKPRHFCPMGMNHPNYSCSSCVQKLFMGSQENQKIVYQPWNRFRLMWATTESRKLHRTPPCQFQIVLFTDKLDRSECWRLSDLSDDQEGSWVFYRKFSVTEWTFPFRNSDLLVSPKTKRQKDKKTQDKDQKESLILWHQGNFALLQCFFLLYLLFLYFDLVLPPNAPPFCILYFCLCILYFCLLISSPPPNAPPFSAAMARLPLVMAGNHFLTIFSDFESRKKKKA